MKWNRELIMLSLVVTLFVIDLLTIRGVTNLIYSFKKNNQILIYSILWTISAFIFIFLIYSFVSPTQIRTAKIISRQYFLTGCVALFYLPKLFFIPLTLLDDLGWLMLSVLNHIGVIRKYLKQRLYLLHRLGVITGFSVFFILFFGIVIGRFQFTIEHQTLEFADLPQSLQGFKIVHLSDIHASSFYENTEKLEEMFSGIVNLKELPKAIFIVDPRKEFIAVAEAKKMRVPIISLLNTDCNIKEIDYPIVGNDASTSSISFFVNEIVSAYKEGKSSTK